MRRTLRLLSALLMLPPAGYASGDALIGNRAMPSTQHLSAVKLAGFDYVELGLQHIAALSPVEFERLRAEVVRLRLPVHSGAYLLPDDVAVTGPAVDVALQMTHVEQRLERAASLGMRVITFAPMNRPEHVSERAAREQLIDFVRRAAAVAIRHDIVLVLQPLQRQRSDFAIGSNFINTVAEALAIVEAVDHVNVGISVDLYHLSPTEAPASLRAAGRHLKHVMISNPQGRLLPMQAGEYDYAALVTTLCAIDYRGAITVFAFGADGVDTQRYAQRAPSSIAFVRSLVKSARLTTDGCSIHAPRYRSATERNSSG